MSETYTAAIGISGSFAAFHTADSGTVINEVSRDQSVEIKTIRNASGVTVQAAVLPMVSTKVSVKGKGIPALSVVAAQSSFTAGTLYVTSLQVEETNEDFPSFTIDLEAYANP